MDDYQIIRLFFERSEQAITELSRKYGALCFQIADNILDDPQDAEECVNDALFAAWNAIPPHTPHDHLYAFLARITRHLALNCCRARKRLKRDAFLCTLSEEMEQCLPSADNVACRLDDLALREAINGFLAALDEEKRNIFLRRYWYLDSVAAISDRFALSESKVKTTLFRCRKRLREHLIKEGYTL